MYRHKHCVSSIYITCTVFFILFFSTVSLAQQTIATANIPNDTGSIHSLLNKVREVREDYPDSVLVIYMKTLAMSERIKDTTGIIISMEGIAMIYRNKSNYDSSAMYYYKAVKIMEQRPATIVTCYVYGGLAVLFTLLKQYNNATVYMDKAEKIARDMDYHFEFVNVLLDRGFMYYKQRELDKYKYYEEQALEISRKYHLVSLECCALTNIGTYYIEKGQPKEALRYLLKAQTYKEGISPYYLSGAIGTLGEAYFMLHDYKKAELYLTRALQIADKPKMVQNAIEIHQLLARLYKEQHQYDKAMEHYQVFVKLKDSLENQEVIKNANLLDIKYRTVQKDKEITQQRLLLIENKNRLREKNLWIWGIVSGVGIFAIMLFTHYRRKQRLQTTVIHNMQQEQKIGQLTAMIAGEEKERTRIARELHDGIGGLLSAAKMNFNTLHHLYDEAPVFHHGIKLLDDAYDELRKTAHNLLPETLLQEGLVNAVMVYCSKINHQKLDLSFQSFGELPRLIPENELSLYRIVQELVQNVIKHAHATKAVTQINVHDGYVHITIEDNGTGMNENPGGNGIGMKNLRSRVGALGGQMDVDSRAGVGTSVYLEFNIDKLQNAAII